MNEAQKIGAAEAAPLAMPRITTPDSASHCRTLPRQALPRHEAYHRKLARVLDRMGGLYLINDILTRIADGRMQSFVVGNSWAITELQIFPRARQLLLLAYVGDLADLDALHDKILAYADEVNAGLIATHGRIGWMREGSFRRLGWRLKAKGHLYHREM